MRLEETVLLHEKDIEKLPPGFLDKGKDAIRIYDIRAKTAALKKVPDLKTDEERWSALVYSPPWGWSTGDDLSLHFHPDRSLKECFVVFSFYPRKSEPSHLDLRIEGPSGVREIPVELPGLQDIGEDTQATALHDVNIGNVEPAEHQLYFEITDACSADVESIRITTQTNHIADDDPGKVEILDYEPNWIRLQARLDRPAFVVISEVFYEGWQATLDGEPVNLLAGDYILRTLPVPEGSHTIELRFRPPTLYWGILITALSLTGLVIYLFSTRSHTQQTRPP
jgi:hypothetical protein